MDTNNANRGEVGFHPVVYGKHLTTATLREEMTTKILVKMTTDTQRNDIEAQVNVAMKEDIQGEYPACLFLLLFDNRRFATIKTNLYNNFLMGKQEYTMDMLSARMLMTDYVPIDGLPKPKQEPLQCCIFVSTCFTY